MTDNLIKRIQNIIKNSTSTKKSNSKHKKTRKEYITQGILKSIATKEKLYIKWYKEKTNKNAKEKYKKYDKILSRVIYKAKELHETNMLRKIQFDTKKTWQYVNEKLNKGKKPEN